jgi:peptidoglycan/LPS O-acetylase OafA/YrhL
VSTSSTALPSPRLEQDRKSKGTGVQNRPGKRFHELDSMRGLAALVVVFHHFAHMFFPDGKIGTGITKFILFPFIAGHASVMLFFLLSGFVLSLPFLQAKSQPYLVFIQRRVLRIYGPYLGALLLSLAGCALWHNRFGAIQWASITWNHPVELKSVAQHLLFIGDYDYTQYNTAFWSLVYEMRISLIFPLLFIIVDRLSLIGSIFVIAGFTLAGIHVGVHQTLITFEYIAIFLIGILLAKSMDQIGLLYKSISPTSRILFALLSAAVYICGHSLVVYGPIWHLGDIPTALGAAGLIVIALNSVVASRLLDTPIPSFLGRISYSLYLVHGTVLFAMTALMGNKISHVLFFGLYLTVSILLSWGFYLGVEAPFMRMSRRVGRTT